jgi:hypothetical protein
MRWALARYGRPQTYTVLNGPQAELTAYVRGVRAEDLFAGANQQDVAAVIDAQAFRAAFPTRAYPQRLDRLRVDGASWAVEEWRGSPNDGQPVFFKLLLRGGRQ